MKNLVNSLGRPDQKTHKIRLLNFFERSAQCAEISSLQNMAVLIYSFMKILSRWPCPRPRSHLYCLYLVSLPSEASASLHPPPQAQPLTSSPGVMSAKTLQYYYGLDPKLLAISSFMLWFLSIDKNNIYLIYVIYRTGKDW